MCPSTPILQVWKLRFSGVGHLVQVVELKAGQVSCKPSPFDYLPGLLLLELKDIMNPDGFLCLLKIAFYFEIVKKRNSVRTIKDLFTHWPKSLKIKISIICFGSFYRETNIIKSPCSVLQSLPLPDCGLPARLACLQSGYV